jgi:hypothetical protein
MIIFNWIGLIFVGLPMVVAWGVVWCIKQLTGDFAAEDGVFCLVTFLPAMTMDLLYRAANYRDRGKLRYLAPGTGGHLFFIPVWAVGIIVFWIAVAEKLRK